MKESQFKTMQGWFDQINQKLAVTATKEDLKTLATKAGLEKFRHEIDVVHGLIHQVHRRIDTHLTDDDGDKRLFKLALERLDQRVASLEARI